MALSRILNISKCNCCYYYCGKLNNMFPFFSFSFLKNRKAMGRRCIVAPNRTAMTNWLEATIYLVGLEISIFYQNHVWVKDNPVLSRQQDHQYQLECDKGAGTGNKV